VDRALALSAGAGYVNGSPLSRAYRDVKAGSFMHPLGANRAYDYLARVALGEQASLQRAFPSHERGRLRGGADDARCGRRPGASARRGRLFVALALDLEAVAKHERPAGAWAALPLFGDGLIRAGVRRWRTSSVRAGRARWR
jgi:hypothetical protein